MTCHSPDLKNKLKITLISKALIVKIVLYSRYFPNLAKLKLEQSNSKKVLNGNVSEAVIMAEVLDTISRNNQRKKRSKTGRK